MLEIKGKYTDAKIFIDDVEDGLFKQIYSVINSQISDGLKTRIMPDCHVGSGICVGFTMELGKYLNPNHVGCDIGCGVNGAMFKKDTTMDLYDIESKIREVMPTGFDIHESPIVSKIEYSDIQISANKFVDKYNTIFNTNYIPPTYNDKWLSDMFKRLKMNPSKFWNSIGTMGGNNHFCEIGEDTNSNYWITIHTGSRNLGVKVFEYWNKIASGDITILPKSYNIELDNIVQNTIPTTDIPMKIKKLKEKYEVGINKEYISGENMINYIFDMIFTQHYASLNRNTILNSIKKVLNINKFDDVIETTHNYIDMNDMIIRKGAVSSYDGKRFLLPFNMLDGILILNGKSNPDWNYSSPHGSGRLFSRSKAKQVIDFDTYKESMKGIVTTSVNLSTVDEAPQSYKDSSLIESLISDTATVIGRIKPLLNIKDTTESISWTERKKAMKLFKEKNK